MKAYDDLRHELKYGSVLPSRFGLAIAATLYAILAWVSPDLSGVPRPADIGSYVLLSGWKDGWAAVFALNAFCLWWRVFDSKPRLVWAALINLSTLALWVGMTGGTVMVSMHSTPEITGHIFVCLIALHTFLRTEFTSHDRDTA